MALGHFYGISTDFSFVGFRFTYYRYGFLNPIFLHLLVHYMKRMISKEMVGLQVFAWNKSWQ